MKKTKLENYVLIHAHLVINERKEYLDGMLAVRGGRIIDLQPQSRTMKEEYSDLPVLDLRGHAVLPLNYAVLLPYTPDLSEDELVLQGIGSYDLCLEKDIRFSLARIREQKARFAHCEGVTVRVSAKEIPKYLYEKEVSGFLLSPEEASPELLDLIRTAGKKILFTDSQKCFGPEETVPEDVVFAQLLRSGELGISERRLLNLEFDQEENYRIFRPEACNMHLLKLVTGCFYRDRVIFDLSAVSAETALQALRKAGIPYRQIAAYLGCNARRCFGREELTLQKGRKAGFCCVGEEGRILFSVREGACYR